MHSKLAPAWKLPPAWLRFFILSLLVLGIFFRLINLDRKLYWHDETYTSLRMSGYTRAEVIQEAFNGQVISSQALRKYQQINPEKGVIGTFKGLAMEEPQHPPLYFVLLRVWTQLFGDSVAAIRSLSAIISLLAFPCLYWLCLELFDSPFVGGIAVGLLAISPFHVLYAQEARQYSLWTVVILLSGVTLLRAMRLKTKSSWQLYAFTVALSCYTFLLSGVVVIGYGIYVAVVERFRLSKTFLAYLVASLAGCLAFLPWLLIVASNSSQVEKTTYWSQQQIGLVALVKKLVLHLSWVFLDVLYGYTPSDLLFDPYKVSYSYKQPFTYLVLAILILVGYAIYFLCRHTPVRVWLFVMTLIGGTSLVLVLPDILLGGQRSGASRYLTPSYLGIELAVAYLLATQINLSTLIRQKVWQGAAIALISAGVFSCTISSQAVTWWNKDNYFFHELSQTINQTNQPLLISDTATTGGLLSLSYLLEPKVKLLLVVEPTIPKIPTGFSDIFLYRPSKTLRTELEQESQYKLERVDRFGSSWGVYRVWKLVRR